jgi:DNA repair photolyase
MSRVTPGFPDVAGFASDSQEIGMIISASRRTDLPAYYTDWFLNRIKERYVCVRNPMNIHQISKINLNPDVVDCIVFWSKNPKPMLDKLQFLKEYTCYFQFTLNSYGRDIEANLPRKKETLETFKKLSDMIGPQKVIWRYDPVFLNEKYTISYHIDKFYELAGILKGYAEKVTFSFIDFYKKITENVKSFRINEMTNEEKNIIAGCFSRIAKENNLLIDTCAEDIDLSKYNIDHARCIDGRLIAKITGYNLIAKKDKNQRLECGCVGSVDIGAYNSCSNACVYCYANYSQNIIANNLKRHNQCSPLLMGEMHNNDAVSERKATSDKTLRNLCP